MPRGSEAVSDRPDGDATGPDPVDPFDPFDGLVLDDDFVRGAAVREAPAHVRARPAPRTPLPPRRNRRARARDWVTSHPFPVFLVVVVAGALVAGLVGVGPLAGLHHSGAAGPAPTTTAAKSTSTTVGGTTTTDRNLVRRSYSRGQCVTWDQSGSSTRDRVTHVVPCSQEHLIEVVGEARAPESSAYGRTGPTAAQWLVIYEQVCHQPVEAYLGVPIDPAGRFAAGAITPSSISWSQGDRQMWCGVVLRPIDGGQLPDGQLAAFTGEAVGASQARLFPTGTCLVKGPSGVGTSAVPCTKAHISEVTGTVTVPATVTSFPTDPQAWQAAVGKACDAMAVAYHGGPLASPLRSGWLEIPRSSWDLGQRTANCAIGTIDASGQPLPLSGSARAGGVPH